MSCEEIVKSLGKEMDLNIFDEDISTVRPLPTYSDTKKGKIVIKFTRRETRNKFYGSRRKITGRRVSTLKSFQDDIDGDGEGKVYVSESLTPFRKKTLWYCQ